jgi:NAD-dependent dihydropyrimidine dehydrogenase PreA subunit
MAQVTVDPRRCEGKRECLRVCPQSVFALRTVDPTLPFFTRLKVAAHGGMQAVVAYESLCTACMKCVEACPEDAIAVVA